MKYVFFLGAQPALAAAEVWRTLERANLAPTPLPAQNNLLLIDLAAALPDKFLNGLGGTHRIGQVIGEQNKPWEAADILEALTPLPAKFRVGVKQDLGLQLKKASRERGVKIKFITPKGKAGQLNAAQVIFNKLTARPNAELSFLETDDGKYYLIRTIQIQDIAAYEARDTRRPVRDARVGMLPPKLAQMMLNIIPDFPSKPPQILDPFCGLGTVVQEGYLMGYKMFGSDISERMVKASRENFKSLKTRANPGLQRPAIFQHDARQLFSSEYGERFDAVVTEPYLGEPVSTPLLTAEIETRQRELAKLYLDFFRNVWPTLKDGAYAVFALPTFRSSVGGAFIVYSPVLFDEIRKLGYHLKHLVPKNLQGYYQVTERGTAIYARPDALVGREITLWHIKKRGDQRN